MDWKAHEGQGRVAELQRLCPAANPKVAGGTGVSKGSEGGRLVTAFPQWHSAAGDKVAGGCCCHVVWDILQGLLRRQRWTYPGIAVVGTCH